MTSLSLLFWIVSGILLQLATYLGIVYWRHWMDYHALPNRGEDLNLTVGGGKSRDAEDISLLPGWTSGSSGSTGRQWKMLVRPFARFSLCRKMENPCRLFCPVSF
jgi:hypothetical protein